MDLQVCITTMVLALLTLSYAKKVCVIDLGFLLDRSISLSRDDCVKENEFVLDIMDSIKLGPFYARTAVAMFAKQVDGYYNFSDPESTDVTLAKNRIYPIKSRGPDTRTADALKFVDTYMFNQTYGARPDVPKVLIVLTDGASTTGFKALVDSSSALKTKKNVNIFAVGIGDSLNMKELTEMASEPKASRVFRANNMDDVLNMVKKLIDESCKEIMCSYVECKYSDWSSWSQSCGLGATRTRQVLSEVKRWTPKVGGCAGLPSVCEETKEKVDKNYCYCSVHKCEISEWLESRTFEDAGCRYREFTRTAQVVTTLVPMEVCVADTKATEECNAQLTVRQEKLGCSCDYVECSLSQWSEWSSSCGARTRIRQYVTTKLSMITDDCEKLPRTCSSELIKEESLETCNCTLASCRYQEWGSWSKTCGPNMVRSRNLQAEYTTVSLPSCSLIRANCDEFPETETEKKSEDCDTMDEIKKVNCSIKFIPVGCFHDDQKRPRPMPEQIFNDRDKTSLVWSGKLINWKDYTTYLKEMTCRCAKESYKRGNSVFGLQFYGECWGGPEAYLTYDRNGAKDPNFCVNGIFQTCGPKDVYCMGRAETNHVYTVLGDV